MRKLNTQSDADLIAAFLSGRSEAQLSPALERKLKRMETASDLLRKYGSRQKVVSMLLKLASYTTMGAKSQATAYRDVDDALEVFGTEARNARDFHVDRLFEMMYSTREKALAQQDMKAVVACEKNIATAIKDFLGGKESIDWSKVQPPRFMVGFFPELLNVPLPTNLDQEIERLLKAKRGKNLTINDAEEAKIVEE